VLVLDRSLAKQVQLRPKADAGNPLHVGAPMPGLVVSMLAEPGADVAAGQKLFTLEAMKMETTVCAERAGRIAEVLVTTGMQVDAGDLLIRLEAAG
jgi:pyruvate carboxylase